MMYKEIIKRLLWREWRENWLFLLVGCGLPLACGRIAQTYEKIGNYEDILGIVMVLIIMMVLMQIAAKSYVTPGKPAKSRLLPVPAAMEFFSAYIIRAITPLLIGTALGVMMGMNTNIITYKEALGIWIATFGVITLTCYSLIVLMSHVSNSIIIGIISGVVYLISLVINVGNTTHGLSSLVYPWFIVGILISIIVFEIGARKSLLLSRIMVVIIMLSTLAIPIRERATDIVSTLSGEIRRGSVKQVDTPVFRTEYSHDFMYRVKNDKDSDGRKVICENIETGLQRVHTFKELSYPLTISDDGSRVLILQQKTNASNAILLRWEPQSDVVTKISDIPLLRSDFVMNDSYVSCDAHTGRDIVVLRSSASSNHRSEYIDVWVIDEVTGRVRMIVGKYDADNESDGNITPRYDIVNWEANQVSYFIGVDKYVVTFPSMTIIKSKMPIARILR